MQNFQLMPCHSASEVLSELTARLHFSCSDPLICIMRSRNTRFFILLAVRLQSAVMIVIYDSTMILKIQYPLRRTEQTKVALTLPIRIRQCQITGNLNFCILECLPYFSHVIFIVCLVR